MEYVGLFQNRYVLRARVGEYRTLKYILVVEECTAFTNWEVMRSYYFGTKYGAGLYEPGHSIYSKRLIKQINECLERSIK